jgi:hypothetical protein
MKLINKNKLAEKIENRIKETESMRPMVDPFWEGQISAFDSVLKILNTLETKEVDLEEVARHYLLHEHISPLNEVLHQADLKVEMQYHKDIEDAYKAGFEVGLKMKGE